VHAHRQLSCRQAQVNLTRVCRNGAITKDDLKSLLGQTNSYLEPVALVRFYHGLHVMISIIIVLCKSCLCYLWFRINATSASKFEGECCAKSAAGCIAIETWSCGLMLQDWLSEAELGQSFDDYDADHSGDISFDEFEHMVNNLYWCQQ